MKLINAGARRRRPKLTGAESLSGPASSPTLGKFDAAVLRLRPVQLRLFPGVQENSPPREL